MNRREIWREVLASEVQRWSALPFEALLETLRDLVVHTVKRNSKVYQVEVQLLRKTDTQVRVLVSVDDGSLPASLIPESATFVVERASKPSTSGSA